MKYLFLIILFVSCANTNIQTRALPQASLRNKPLFYPKVIQKLELRNMNKTKRDELENKMSKIEVFQPGMNINKPLFCFAEIFASSTPASTHEDILTSIIREAARLNADVVRLGNHNLQNTGSITTYGSGIAMSHNTQVVYTYGQACDYSEVSLGISTDNNGKIIYVKKNSAAEDIGITENMQLIAINGKPVGGSVIYVLATEVNSKKPGEKILIEYLDLKNNKIRKEVILKKFVD